MNLIDQTRPFFFYGLKAMSDVIRCDNVVIKGGKTETGLYILTGLVKC